MSTRKKFPVLILLFTLASYYRISMYIYIYIITGRRRDVGARMTREGVQRMENPKHSRLLFADDVQRAGRPASLAWRQQRDVCGWEGGWIGAARGRMVVYTESRGCRGPRAYGRGVRVAGWDGRGWCRWSRRRCSLHEPSPLSCARESVLADHCRRKDGQIGPCFIVVVFVVVVLVFDIYYRAVHVDKAFSAIRAQSDKIIIYVICASGEPSVCYWCW